MSGFLPASDNALNAWAENFSTYLTANAVALGLSSSDATALAAKLTAFSDGLTTHNTAVANAKAVRAFKQAYKAALVSDIRGLARRVQANPTTTNGQRQALGITVPGPGPTPVPAPTTIPNAAVEKNAGFQQVLRLTDSGTNKRKRPAGAIGAEVYMAIAATTPTSLSQLALKDINSSTRVIQEFETTDAGKSAYYAFRWINTRGERGPWSEMTSVTIAA